MEPTPPNEDFGLLEVALPRKWQVRRNPRPIKLNPVSDRIIPGTANVNEAMMWLMKEGIMWRKIMRISLEPEKRAAITKSSSRNERNRPRTTRAKPVQPTNAKSTVTMK